LNARIVRYERNGFVNNETKDDEMEGVIERNEEERKDKEHKQFRSPQRASC
jgi:hypothetical protein